MKRAVGFGEIQNGKLKLRNEETFKEQLARMKGTVEIIVERTHSKRSLNQNAYYWGVMVKILSDELGYEPDEVHEILKQKFNPQNLKIQDQEIVIGGSTTKMSTIDFMAYVEQIQRWAASYLHISIPSPNEENPSS